MMFEEIREIPEQIVDLRFGQDAAFGRHERLHCLVIENL